MTGDAPPVRGPESLLDHLLPGGDVRQVHEAWVPAPAAVVFSAVKEVTGREVRALLPLELLRWLPGFLAGHRPFWPDLSAPLLTEFTAGVVSLAERTGSEAVAGAVGRFWRIAGNEPAPIRTRADFVAFSEPGYAKAAIAFVVFPEREGTRVTTETRVVGTSAEATRLLRRYWFVIRPASDAIRRSWLAAIRRRALRSLATSCDERRALTVPNSSQARATRRKLGLSWTRREPLAPSASPLIGARVGTVPVRTTPEVARGPAADVQPNDLGGRVARNDATSAAMANHMEKEQRDE